MNIFKIQSNSVIHSLSLLAIIVFLTGCHSTKDFTTNNIVVETTPGASLFWKGGELDGGYINTANDKGIAIIWLSKYAYKKNEQKRIIIAKEKFKPQELELKYTTRNSQGDNHLLLSINSEHTANDFWEAGCSAKKNQKKIELFKQALYQDPLNVQGIGIQAASQLCDIYLNEKDYNIALQYATMMVRISPSEEIGRKKTEQIILVLTEKMNKDLQKLERIQKTNKAVQAFNTALASSNTATISNSSTSDDQPADISTQNSSSKGRKKASASNAQNEMRDRRTYSNYVDQLSRMKTGLDQYNDTNRRNIQEKMRQLREKHGFPKNELEDWDGK